MKFFLSVALLFLSQTALSDTKSDADMIFNWAEHQLPELFFPAGEPSLDYEEWYFRSYPETEIHIGVNTETLDVYLSGEVFGGFVKLASLSTLMNELIPPPDNGCNGLYPFGDEFYYYTCEQLNEDTEINSENAIVLRRSINNYDNVYDAKIYDKSYYENYYDGSEGWLNNEPYLREYFYYGENGFYNPDTGTDQGYIFSVLYGANSQQSGIVETTKNLYKRNDDVFYDDYEHVTISSKKKYTGDLLDQYLQTEYYLGYTNENNEYRVIDAIYSNRTFTGYSLSGALGNSHYDGKYTNYFDNEAQNNSECYFGYATYTLLLTIANAYPAMNYYSCVSQVDSEIGNIKSKYQDMIDELESFDIPDW